MQTFLGPVIGVPTSVGQQLVAAAGQTAGLKVDRVNETQPTPALGPIEATADDKKTVPISPLLAGIAPGSDVGRLLSRREHEVMELLVKGASNGQIAAQLVIAEETGYESDDWVSIHSVSTEPARHTTRAHFFCARNARPTRARRRIKSRAPAAAVPTRGRGSRESRGLQRTRRGTPARRARG